MHYKLGIDPGFCSESSASEKRSEVSWQSSAGEHRLPCQGWLRRIYSPSSLQQAAWDGASENNVSIIGTYSPRSNSILSSSPTVRIGVSVAGQCLIHDGQWFISHSYDAPFVHSNPFARIFS